MSGIVKIDNRLGAYIGEATGRLCIGHLGDYAVLCLDQRLASAMLPILQHFAEHGTLPEQEEAT